ncbi:hypothetical protein DID88_008567 [Monilinia fructigena]|uniref:Uncharacterized protein n=1 Tax=Monilinia fructigena TaxID=38457 RepID=A0A395J675_9HELO|nr:hypothetical protein DID88_008567 [Monilinia fructigena]
MDNSGQHEGVMVRKDRTEYLCRPPALANSTFGRAMKIMNVSAAMTINSTVVQPFLTRSPDALDVPLTNGLRIQILPTLEDLPRARRGHYAAFIAREALLVVWEDDPTLLFDRAKAIEDGLLQTIWSATEHEKSESQPRAQVSDVDEESGQPVIEERPVMFLNSFMVACSICLLVCIMGLGYAQLALEGVVLHHWISLCYLIMTPIYCFFTLFFTNVVIGVLMQLFGPIQQLSKNSKFFSAKAPPRLLTSTLPHVTIQCPKAISTYELQGGSANIFINDDGLQLLDEATRQQRMTFIADHGIGWTARPPNGQNGYERKGKFKKASNMNYGLALSNAIEEKLQDIQRPATWTQVDEVAAFESCLADVLDENPEAWAEGNIRIGDYILIIDSDTQVPEDCLLDAASEMEQSPEVGIIQFSSAVMQVSHNFFENGITFFTNLIYSAIRYGVANGGVAAFVGHNAILRWSALQEIAFEDEDDMSDSGPSLNYTIRMAAWAGDGFKEGVSLTVYDELTRWQKNMLMDVTNSCSIPSELGFGSLHLHLCSADSCAQTSTLVRNLFLPAILENIKWAVMFMIFFGGVSLHLSQALLCHMFEIDMSWGATSKEVEFSNFFLEVPKILKTFKYTYIMCITGIIGMIIMAEATFLPWSWNIVDFIAIFPLGYVC